MPHFEGENMLLEDLHEGPLNEEDKELQDAGSAGAHLNDLEEDINIVLEHHQNDFSIKHIEHHRERAPDQRGLPVYYLFCQYAHEPIFQDGQAHRKEEQ